MTIVPKEKVTITLSKDLLEAIRKHTTPRGQSRFIAEAITFYLAARQQEALAERLMAGYQANAGRDQAIAAEWTAVEAETLATLTDEKHSV